MALIAVLLVSQALSKASANGAHDVDGNLLELDPHEMAMTQSGYLGDQTPTIEYWADLTPEEKQGKEPPYTPPKDWVYNTSSGPVEGKVNVHLVPHSHDDVGWQVTVDQYFYEEVFYIYDTVLERLEENEDRHFIAVEVGFFARWWNEAPESKRNRTKAVVAKGQLEFVNGGWCMHDEATPSFVEMTDQTTRGHQFIYSLFGVRPRGTWSVDPFGHSDTQAWLLSYDAGMPSLFWGRMDWQDRQQRTEGFEWVWRGAASFPDKKIFAGNLFGTGSGGYATWFNFDSTNDVDQVQDDPEMMDFNVDQWVDKFVQDAQTQAAHTRGGEAPASRHVLFACGTDFQYTNADYWYRNLDKLIHYANLNGTVNAFYSTPTLYADAKNWTHDATPYDERGPEDEILPLADDAHDYWTGFFTSRPALKRQVRVATNLLTAARFLEVLASSKVALASVLSKVQVELKPAPRVGDSWTDGLEGAVALATHHDGMSGTERQDVTDDYELRIAQQAVVAETGVQETLRDLLGMDSSFDMCGCNGAPEATCLNASTCDATATRDEFSVFAWNSLAQPRTEVLRFPVGRATDWACVSGRTRLDAGVLFLDDRTRGLPLSYLNKFNLSEDDVAAAQAALANKAKALLSVKVDLPALGLAKIDCKKDVDRFDVADVATKTQRLTPPKKGLSVTTTAASQLVCNEFYCLTFDTATKELTRIENRASNVSSAARATWGWFNSSVGGCSDYNETAENMLPACSGQKSGAYIFRPNSSDLLDFGPFEKTTTIALDQATVAEVRCESSAFTSHVFRLYAGAPFVEVEWTAGPIPIDTPWYDPVAYDGDVALPNNWGKEVIFELGTALKTNGTFFTDSNARELVKRVRDKRGGTYPSPYQVSEPVAGNFYPVTSLAALDDGKTEFNVAVDAALGASSLEDGSLQFMVHRRLQDDDARGVQEPLNETQCGCNDINAAPGDMGEFGHEGDGGCVCDGLTVRGTFRLALDSLDAARRQRRQNALRLSYPPTLAFTDLDVSTTFPNVSLVRAALPENVQLLTLTSNYAAFHGGAWLLRFAHLYQVDEHPTLSQPVTLNLQTIFSNNGTNATGIPTVVNATETTLTANQPKNTDFAFPLLTIAPMEVRTFLAFFQASS